MSAKNSTDWADIGPDVPLIINEGKINRERERERKRRDNLELTFIVYFF